MEIPFMDHVRHSLTIDRNKDVIIDKLLNLTLEIFCLLTGEDYVVVRKSEKSGRRASDECSEARSLITGGSPPSPGTEEDPSRRIPEPARNLYRGTEKLPIKSEDAEVSAWSYSSEQRDAVSVGGLEARCSDDSAPIHQRIFEPSDLQDSTDPKANYISAARSTGSPPRKCRPPLCSQDCITQEGQAEPPGDGMFHQQCKEEEDTAVPDDDDDGSGGDDSSDHQEQYPDPACCEDFIEEDNQTMPQDYRSDVRDEIFPQTCKEEAGPDYMNSDLTVSALDVLAIHPCSEAREHLPDHSDPDAGQKSPCTNNLFSCSICGVRFGSETTFAAHQRFHAEEKSYDCIYCGKSFNQRSRLLSHKRKHTGEKPFSCPVCGRCFAERSALVTHQRIHSGEKPFNCTECTRSFVQRSSLVKHQRIHTGERPFVCAQCGRCFSQSSNLVRHQRILHQFL